MLENYSVSIIGRYGSCQKILGMEELLVSLRQDLIIKFGHPLIYPKDCSIMSEEIRRTTSRSVSTTTLKRFFRIIEHNHQTSRYVLDTFSIYLGFKSLYDYLNCIDKDKHIHKEVNSWDLLRQRVNHITLSSLNSIKLKSGYNKKKIVPRPFANRIFSEFCRSDKTITALIAPRGYGKSSIILQLIDSFFWSNQAAFPQDIVCVIDGELFINIISRNRGLELLEQFIEFDLDKSLLNLFTDEKKSVDGNIIIIIDDVDEIYYNVDKFHHFIGNLMRMVMAFDGKRWFKILISFKPENLKFFLYFIEKYPSLKSQWFGVPLSENSNENINIPMFTEEEVRNIMKVNNFLLPIETLHYLHYDLIRVIKFPYLLFSFIELNKHNVMVSELDLIEDYVHLKIFSGAYGNEKLEIIHSLLKMTHYGEMSGSVRKKSLPLGNHNMVAFNELISNGIIYETQIQESYLHRSTYCNLLNKDLFNYIVALSWISNYGITPKLLTKLNAHYRNNLSLKLSIFHIIIKAAIKEGNLEFLKQLHMYFEKKWNTESEESNRSIDSHYQELASAISLELRKYRELRDQMMIFFATSELGRILFFERNFDLDSIILYSADNYKYYFEYSKIPESRIYANFINFLKGFLSGDDSLCHSAYEINNQTEWVNNKDPITEGLSGAVNIIYQSCICKYSHQMTIEEIMNISDSFNELKSQKVVGIPVYGFIILSSLNYTDRYNDTIKFAEHIYSHYDHSCLHSSFHYQYHLLFYAHALLHSGRIEEALQSYHLFESAELPPLMKYYMLITQYFIDVDFLLNEGNHNKALLLIGNIRNISRFLKFRYYFVKADRLKYDILRKPKRVTFK